MGAAQSIDPRAFQRRQVEVEAGAGVVRGECVAVLHLQGYGHTPLQPKGVHFQVDDVGAGGQQIDLHAVGAVRDHWQVVGLGQPGDLHEGASLPLRRVLRRARDGACLLAERRVLLVHQPHQGVEFELAEIGGALGELAHLRD